MPLNIKDCVEEAYRIATEHGWWTLKPERTFGDQIALMHSELSEALEEFRDGKPHNLVYFNGDKPEGIPIEFADVLIRIFDTCGRYNIDLEHAVEIKMAYNETRPMRHGGRVI